MLAAIIDKALPAMGAETTVVMGHRLMIFGAGYTSEPERKESRESDCRFLTRGNGQRSGCQRDFARSRHQARWEPLEMTIPTNRQVHPRAPQ